MRPTDSNFHYLYKTRTACNGKKISVPYDSVIVRFHCTLLRACQLTASVFSISNQLPRLSIYYISTVNTQHMKNQMVCYNWVIPGDMFRPLSGHLQANLELIPPWSPSEHSHWEAMHRCQRPVHPSKQFWNLEF